MEVDLNETNIFKGDSQSEDEEPSYTYTSYTNAERTYDLRLLGKSPGSLIKGNAGKRLARYIDEFPAVFADKFVLELGAGAALPSLVAARYASCITITDYPDPGLIQNIEYNVEAIDADREIHVEGYIWGNKVDSILSWCHHGYDVILLADLIFNHSEHTKLLRCIQNCLARNLDALALVFFTPHRPYLVHKDMAFFNLAESHGFSCRQLLCEKWQPMFEVDTGSVELRSLVFGYEMRWTSDGLDNDEE